MEDFFKVMEDFVYLANKHTVNLKFDHFLICYSEVRKNHWKELSKLTRRVSQTDIDKYQFLKKEFYKKFGDVRKEFFKDEHQLNIFATYNCQSRVLSFEVEIVQNLYVSYKQKKILNSINNNNKQKKIKI